MTELSTIFELFASARPSGTGDRQLSYRWLAPSGSLAPILPPYLEEKDTLRFRLVVDPHAVLDDELVTRNRLIPLAPGRGRLVVSDPGAGVPPYPLWESIVEPQTLQSSISAGKAWVDFPVVSAKKPMPIFGFRLSLFYMPDGGLQEQIFTVDPEMIVGIRGGPPEAG